MHVLKKTKDIRATGRSSDRPGILWLTNIPSPYRVDFFNELGRFCDLTVLFEKERSAERDEQWKGDEFASFRGVILKGLPAGPAEAFCPGVLRYLRKEYDYIIVSNYSDPSGILAVLYLKARKRPYLIEGDGAFPGSGSGSREKLKKWIISGASLCFSTGRMHDAYLRMYGAKNILRYPFTSLKAEEILDKPLEARKKAEIRTQLGIHERRVVLAVGQFIHRKGYDVLLKAAAVMDRTAGFYIVGGTAPTGYKEVVRHYRLKHVHFIPFMPKEQLKQYYLAADVFAHPSREDIWGLAVNEALARALPVVSTNRCNAALELVKDGVNGFIIPAEDSAALAAALQVCFRRKDMPEKALASVRPYTIEKMVERHVEALRSL